MRRIGIIGAGAWGTALALVARRAGLDVVIQAREPDVVEAINGRHENPLYLPGIGLDAAIRATTSAAEAAAGAEAVLLAVPAQHLRPVLEAVAPAWPGGVPAVVCAKGIEQGSGMLMTEVTAACLSGVPLAVLSGPTFAVEVARGLPTAVTLACVDEALGRRLAGSLAGPRLRVYWSDDPVGAEIGGAVKNVLAIACGVVMGRGLGDNARAALITRGLAEIARLGRAKGARPETLMGLSGLGDLVLTCNALQSRNFSVGVALGKGKRLAQVVEGRRSIAEGVFSAAAVVALAKSLGVEMPISAAVDAILNHGADIDEAVAALLARPPRAENAT